MAIDISAKTIAKKVCFQNEMITLINGDVLEILPEIPSGIAQTCVTSPPYWGLRDYKVEGQIGAEDDFAEYITVLVEVFREIRRLLRDDGTLWLNIGDSFTSGGRRWRAPDKKNPGRAMSYRPPTPAGLKPKDIIGVPWRLAMALQADGWFLRSDIVWHKPNCQPESVKDRPTRAHEYVFLLSKSKRYFYDYKAIMEDANGAGNLRNRRSVWSINTEPFSGAHFAVFPTELVKLCILAGSNSGSLVVDPFLGTGTVAQVALENQRKCLGVELSKEYSDMAINRIGCAQLGLDII